MKNITKFVLIAGALLVNALTATAQTALVCGPSNAAIRVFNYYTSTVSFACLNKGTNYTVTVDGIAQTITGTNASNVSALLAAIGGITNVAGNTYLYGDGSTALAKDTIPGALANTSNNIPANGYATLYFNATDCGFYQVAIPSGNLHPPATSYPVGDPQRPGIALLVPRIWGQPIGTGTVTVAAYVGGSVAYQRSFPSPTYVTGPTNTINSTDDIYFDVATPSIYVGNGVPFILRASRATTTLPGTGVIGVNTQPYGNLPGW